MAKENPREILRKVIRGVPKTFPDVERSVLAVKKVIDSSRASSSNRVKPRV